MRKYRKDYSYLRRVHFSYEFITHFYNHVCDHYVISNSEEVNNTQIPEKKTIPLKYKLMIAGIGLPVVSAFLILYGLNSKSDVAPTIFGAP